MQTLDPDTIRERLSDLDGWELEGDRLVRSWDFVAFRDAIGFINRVAELADEADHHPDLYNSYTTVRLALTTHSEGGITSKDLELAARIDEVVTT